MSVARDLENLRDGLARSDRMPLVFLGHGSPMNVVADNAFSRA